MNLLILRFAIIIDFVYNISYRRYYYSNSGLRHILHTSGDTMIAPVSRFKDSDV